MQKKEKRKIALVLGGTAPHIKLLEHLKKIGFYTLLIDYLDNPAAKPFADEHIQLSTLDKDRVLQTAIERKADLVISACIDQANSVCCFVAERLNLPKPYSYETSVLVTDKSEMKRIFTENRIPTSWYYTSSDINSINWDQLTFPAVVKPVDCNSSKGVRRVESISDAKRYFKEAVDLSRTKKAIIEGFVDGTEIQVDCFAHKHDAQIILTRQKKKFSVECGDELNSEGSIIPSPICKKFESELLSIAKSISNGFSLENTPFFYQAIIDKNGRISVLEFAPRVGGGLSYYLLNELAGFDAVGAVINSYLGITEPINLAKLNHLYSTNLLYMKEGYFDHIEGLEIAKELDLIKEFFVFKNQGSYISSDLRSGNRVGAFIAEADSLQELSNKENQVYKLIDIIDINGMSKMKERAGKF